MVTIRDGLPRKELRHPTPTWYRQAIQKCFNADEVKKLIDKVKQDSPKDALAILLNTLPKEHKVDATNTIQLIINGLQQSKPIDGTIRPALPEHEDDPSQVLEYE